MAEKFGIYRASSCRHKGHDYSLPGTYFVTITIQNRTPFFGVQQNGSIFLSDYGIVAQKSWLEIPDHFHNVCLDVFVIMPDHIHGLILIDSMVETLHATSLRQFDKFMSVISPKSGSLGAIIRSYKSAVSRTIHGFEPGFKWQSGYYDHIVRGQNELHRIQKYIRENPLNGL